MTPVRNLRGTFSPRRNHTFTVVVLSYHPETSQTVNEAVTSVGSDIFVANTTAPVKAGVYAQSAAGQVRNLLGDYLTGKPTYVYRVHGLTPGQAAQKAAAIAADIAKRSFVINGEIDGDPTIVPGLELNFVEQYAGDMIGFANRQMTVTSVTHEYSFPQGGDSGSSGDGSGDGYLTRFAALLVKPPPGAAATLPGFATDDDEAS